MFNLYEIMRAAQGGEAMNNMARQFGLSVEQTQRAIEALLPAFSLGLLRNAQNPKNLVDTLGLMGSGQFAPFFEQPSAIRSGNAASQGKDVLNVLFGPPEVSRQVAAHAAILSGVSTEVLMRMLPVLGAMIMGGLFKTAMSEGFGGLLLQMNEIWQRSLAGLPMTAPAPPPPPPPPPAVTMPPAAAAFTELFNTMMAAMFGQRPPAAAESAPQPAPAAQPKPAAALTTPTPPAETAAGEPPSAPDAPDQLAAGQGAPVEPPPFDAAKFGFEQFSRMFETGLAAQEQQLAAMRTAFEQLSHHPSSNGKSR